jgi:hypothetical protein
MRTSSSADSWGETFDGSFTVQCKFSQKPGRSVSVASVAEELDKAARLASRGLAENYFLFTNMQLTGTADEVQNQIQAWETFRSL